MKVYHLPLRRINAFRSNFQKRLHVLESNQEVTLLLSPVKHGGKSFITFQQ